MIANAMGKMQIVNAARPPRSGDGDVEGLGNGVIQILSSTEEKSHVNGNTAISITCTSGRVMLWKEETIRGLKNEVKDLRDTFPNDVSKYGSEITPTEDELQVMVKLIGSNSQMFNQLNPISSGGAVYIRWGHYDCPPSSEKVYNGTAAGANHRVSGGGADQLCLTTTPNYDGPVDGEGTSRAYIYAIEYQIDDFPKYNSRLWYDVPCAVCKATSRYSQLMVPGTNKCPSSEWTLEYGGFLMADRSNHQAHHRSLHVCVDREMQVVPGSGSDMSDNNRGMLNLVEARCSHRGGGIPCGIMGGYVDSYEITCAVCTM